MKLVILEHPSQGTCTSFHLTFSVPHAKANACCLQDLFSTKISTDFSSARRLSIIMQYIKHCM